MSAYKDMIIDIQDEIEAGELTLEQIAAKYEFSVKEITLLAQEMAEQDTFYHDGFERDHDEPYEQEEQYYPDPDAHYENQYDLEDY